ncbi:hypothetical protein DSM110093_02381 [Sulfitobacter sp. DSM 110093]|uniref:tryptophan synthase subunit beta n=1 Tax=Sulfitobacter sp. DSM 110093 TaxID=2883127 RepID=UPI001FAE6426|nr:tryptophan synthase subunit beta [Sulfitobacter sp. DSM 110093]UOA32579.1 hypothetical protein DSM110093_02381 [Sulfitobacter sp. DSM 110093]
MKTAFATAALILATTGTAAFAQGMEGQRIGYNDQANDGVSYSSRSEAVDESKLENFKSGNLRAEDLSDVTITVFPTAQSDASVNRFPR